MSVATAPCGWPVNYAACGPSDALEALDPADKATFELVSSTYLWLWTNRKYGVCERKVRPCRADCQQQSTFGPGLVNSGFGPVLTQQGWQSVMCGKCQSDQCSCSTMSQLWLPGTVDEVTEVLIDGTPQSLANYRVDNHQILVALADPLPVCQDLSKAETEPGTWQVTYDDGIPVPLGGQIAAGVLTEEFAKASCNDKSCQLPQRVQSITRQGVTIAMLDAFDDIDKGHTGIWLIDSWVASVTKTKQTSIVRSPDI